ncbi:MAG: hypothetical protein MZW92_01230 [Comamonadaceae bacterium]|nr:hypothetical protein [Comamonadaceae bacterium]
MLVGTTSIENSELLSGAARRRRSCRTRCSTPSSTPREAEIVAQAGRPGDDHHRHQHGRPRHRHRARRQRREADRSSSRPTRRSPTTRRSARIAQAARRVAERCTSRWWPPAACTSSAPSATRSRRIDNQLRGRSGRQGDPGSVALLPVARRPADAHLRRRPRAARSWTG